MMMKKLVAISLALISFNLFAVEARPGLWEVNMKVTQGDKIIDPVAALMEELDKLPAEQKQKILEEINKKSNMKHGLTKTCYTKEMLKNPTKIATGENEECKFDETSKTAKKAVATFKCEDGSSGTSVWEIRDERNMKVTMDFTDKNGKTGKVDYTAKFLKDNCN